VSLQPALLYDWQKAPSRTGPPTEIGTVAMRIEDVNKISHEDSIVWVRGGPDDYPYVMEEMVSAATRARGPGRCVPNLKNLVAYATLGPGAVRSKKSGGFLRRLWLFRESDPVPCERDNPNYGVTCPSEGVKPHSIRARELSEHGRE
jgi:hypothetical protein